MSDEDKAPKLGDWVWQRVFQRFGIQGLVGLALVAAVFFVWTQWDTVKTWPDISSLVAYLSREAVPPANSHQFYVAVADLEDDNANGDHKRLIVSLLQDFEGIQVLSFDRTITVKEPVPGEQERTGHQRAREYLKESNASILIWGSVLRHGKQTKPELYLTVAGGKLDKSKQYTLEIGTEFHLPMKNAKGYPHSLARIIRQPACNMTRLQCLGAGYQRPVILTTAPSVGPGCNS